MELAASCAVAGGKPGSFGSGAGSSTDSTGASGKGGLAAALAPAPDRIGQALFAVTAMPRLDSVDQAHREKLPSASSARQ